MLVEKNKKFFQYFGFILFLSPISLFLSFPVSIHFFGTYFFTSYQWIISLISFTTGLTLLLLSFYPEDINLFINTILKPFKESTGKFKKKLKLSLPVLILIAFIILINLSLFKLLGIIISIPSDLFFLFSFLLDSKNLPNINWLVWNFASDTGNLIGPFFNYKVIHLKTNIFFSFPFTNIRYKYDGLVIFKYGDRVTSNLTYTTECGFLPLLIIVIFSYSILNYSFHRNINKTTYFSVVIILFISHVIFTMLRLTFIILGLMFLLNFNYSFESSFVIIHDLIGFFYFIILYFYMDNKIIRFIETQSNKPFFLNSLKFRLIGIRRKKYVY